MPVSEVNMSQKNAAQLARELAQSGLFRQRDVVAVESRIAQRLAEDPLEQARIASLFATYDLCRKDPGQPAMTFEVFLAERAISAAEIKELGNEL